MVATKHQKGSTISPWQNCGTGVSPVVFTVKNGAFKPLFSLSPRADSQGSTRRAHHASSA